LQHCGTQLSIDALMQISVASTTGIISRIYHATESEHYRLPSSAVDLQYFSISAARRSPLIKVKPPPTSAACCPGTKGGQHWPQPGGFAGAFKPARTAGRRTFFAAALDKYLRCGFIAAHPGLSGQGSQN
jgi:hypothetical protein